MEYTSDPLTLEITKIHLMTLYGQIKTNIGRTGLFRKSKGKCRNCGKIVQKFSTCPDKNDYSDDRSRNESYKNIFLHIFEKGSHG